MSSRRPASARARRILTLLHLFSSQDSLPLRTVADALGVGEAEARREIDLLSCCGVYGTDEQLVPVFVDDELEPPEVVFWGEPPALERQLRLSVAETRALVAALTAAGLDADDPLLRKLERALGSTTSFESVEQMLRGATAIADSEILKALTLAVDEHRVVRITYHKGGAAEGTSREVEPLALVQELGDWYLEAYCRRARDLRTFRFDRISAADVSDERFEPRGTAPAGLRFLDDALPTASVRLAPGADYSAREWPGSRVIETDSDGSRLVEVPYAGTGWIARQVVARLGDAEVISPAEVRTAVADLAAEILADY